MKKIFGLGMLLLLAIGLAISTGSKTSQSIAEEVATNDASVQTLAQVVEITSAPKPLVVHDKGGTFSVMSSSKDSKGPVPPVNPYLK